MPEYAIILLVLLVVGFLLHYTSKVKIYASQKQLLVFQVVLLVIGVIWDGFAISRGHWAYGEKFMLGWQIGVVPIEDFAFFIIVPYFFLVVYRISEKYLSK